MVLEIQKRYTHRDGTRINFIVSESFADKAKHEIVINIIKNEKERYRIDIDERRIRNELLEGGFSVMSYCYHVCRDYDVDMLYIKRYADFIDDIVNNVLMEMIIMVGMV